MLPRPPGRIPVRRPVRAQGRRAARRLRGTAPDPRHLLPAQAIDNDPAAILAATTEIAAAVFDDGVAFDIGTATARQIRDEDLYQGVRVSMTARLSSARPALHADISVGDPIVPAPRMVQLPRVLGGELTVRGYPLSMVHAEKFVTAISRGTTSTRS